MSQSLVKDYLELTKPKVVLLMLLTSAVGMLLAANPNQPPWFALILGNIGIAMAAGSAAVVNHLVDQRIDTMMARTQKRPVAQGRITPFKASVFATLLGLVGLFLLYVLFSPLAAVLTLLTLMGYAVVYTMYLKHATPQNIVIGGLAGAAPPLLGWVCVTGTIEPCALLLVLIIYAWTPPHFWALAIFRHEDYAKAKVPMLPVTHGIPFTKLSIVLYTILMIGCTLLPFLIGATSWIYLFSAIALGALFMGFSIALYYSKDDKIALMTFIYSIFYLMALFVALLLDHYLTFYLKGSL